MVLSIRMTGRLATRFPCGGHLEITTSTIQIFAMLYSVICMMLNVDVSCVVGHGRAQQGLLTSSFKFTQSIAIVDLHFAVC